MSNIESFEHRLALALDRIAAGLDAQAIAEQNDATSDSGIDALAAAQAEVESLRAAATDSAAKITQLETDLAAKTGDVAGLQKKLDAADAAQAVKLAEAAEQVANLKLQMSQMDEALTRQRTASAEVRDALAALRTAQQDDAMDAGQINRAMMAELEALAADRAADSAEIDTILGTLKPLIKKGAANAAG